MRIGVDLMGSERSPQALYEALVQTSRHLDPGITWVVFSDASCSPSLPNVEWIEAPETITMDDSPLLAARRKKNSSMAIGLRLLKNKKIDAFVTAGNTGAMVALSRLHLSLLEGITSPALLVWLPTERGRVAVLDVGANISFKAEHFIEYAKLGIAYRKVVDGMMEPRVALLNIGAEEKKGTTLVKEGFQILQQHFSDQPGAFMGNLEARDLFEKGADVLVTDGFTGNVFLKTCEGVSSFLLDFFKRQFSKKEGMEQMMHAFRHQFNTMEQGGAFLIGLDAVVVKCHGQTDASSFGSGLQAACQLVEKNIIEKMRKEICTG